MSPIPDYIFEVRARVSVLTLIPAMVLNGVFAWGAVMAIYKLFQEPNETSRYVVFLVIMIGLLAYCGEILFWYAFGKEVFRVEGNKLTVYYRNCYASEKETFRLNQMWRISIAEREQSSLSSNVIIRLIAGILILFNLESIGYWDLRGRKDPIISFVYKAQERAFGTEISTAQAHELFHYLLAKGYLQSNRFQKSRT
jgi:hypothetical protein